MYLGNVLELFPFIITILVHGQNQIDNIRWRPPTDCALKNQIFNPITLNCVSCPNGMIPTSNADMSNYGDLGSCVCITSNNTSDLKNCPNCWPGKFAKKYKRFKF